MQLVATRLAILARKQGMGPLAVALERLHLESRDSAAVRALQVGQIVRLQFPAVGGATRRKWMKRGPVTFRVTERISPRKIEVEPEDPKQPPGTLYVRPGFAARYGSAVELDQMLALYGRDGLGHTTGHPVEVAEVGPTAPAGWRQGPLFARRNVAGCSERGLAVQMALYPLADKPRYFASGAHHPGEIRAYRELGQGAGTAANALDKKRMRWVAPCNAACEREYRDFAGTGLQVFVDSGAFSEVVFPEADAPPVVVAPLSDRDWRRAFDMYARLGAVLGEQLHVVAPDRVGDQDASLARLRKYQPELAALRAQGVHIIVPLQRGRRSLSELDAEAAAALGFDDYTVGIPSEKAATPTETVRRYLRARAANPPARIHFLGLGSRSPRRDEVLDAVMDYAPGAQTYLDSVLHRAFVAFDTQHPGDPARGIRPGGRLLSRAADAVLAEMREGMWGATSLEVWADHGFPALDYTEMIGEPGEWLSKGQIRALGHAAGLDAAQRRRWNKDPAAFLRESPQLAAAMEAPLDDAWDRFWTKATVAERKRLALLRAYPQMAANPVGRSLAPARARRLRALVLAAE